MPCTSNGESTAVLIVPMLMRPRRMWLEFFCQLTQAVYSGGLACEHVETKPVWWRSDNRAVTWRTDIWNAPSFDILLGKHLGVRR